MTGPIPPDIMVQKQTRFRPMESIFAGSGGVPLLNRFATQSQKECDP